MWHSSLEQHKEIDAEVSVPVFAGNSGLTSEYEAQESRMNLQVEHLSSLHSTGCVREMKSDAIFRPSFPLRWTNLMWKALTLASRPLSLGDMEYRPVAKRSTACTTGLLSVNTRVGFVDSRM